MDLSFSSSPWPWYVAGPLIGLMVPMLRLVGGKSFGLSSNLRHLCAATIPGKAELLCYDWRKAGRWNLAFAVGILGGAALAGAWLGGSGDVAITEGTRVQLAALGIGVSGLVPDAIFGLESVGSVLLLLGGGFLVGFGARYAGGCTSGHAITGLADFQAPSLVAVVGFFAGGLVSTHFLLPFLMGG